MAESENSCSFFNEERRSGASFCGATKFLDIDKGIAASFIADYGEKTHHALTHHVLKNAKSIYKGTFGSSDGLFWALKGSQTAVKYK